MSSRDYWIKLIEVSGGVILGQLIGIVGFLVLTWLYQPAEFGTYASWLSVVTIGSVLCTGALETSLVRDGDGGARDEAAAKVLWTAVLGSGLVSVACGIGLSQVPSFLPGNRLLIAASIGIAVFALAANIVLQSWAAAGGLFRPLTILRIVQSSLIMLFPLALSAAGRTSNMLVLGHTLGLLVSLGAWLTVFPRSSLRWVVLREIAAFWSERARCFIYVLPALAIGTLAGNLPQLAVNWRFGSAAAGHLALAQRVLGVPLSLVGIAVRDVFKRFASVSYREKGECAREFWSSFAALAAIATVFGLVMQPLSETLFVLVFGEPWRTAGQMARWLLPMFGVAIVASPLTYLVYIVEREDFDLYWQSALLVVVAATLCAFNDVQTTLQVFALSYAAMYGIYMFACARFAHGGSLGNSPAGVQGSTTGASDSR